MAVAVVRSFAARPVPCALLASLDQGFPGASARFVMAVARFAARVAGREGGEGAVGSDSRCFSDCTVRFSVPALASAIPAMMQQCGIPCLYTESVLVRRGRKLSAERYHCWRPGHVKELLARCTDSQRTRNRSCEMKMWDEV